MLQNEQQNLIVQFNEQPENIQLAEDHKSLYGPIFPFHVMADVGWDIPLLRQSILASWKFSSVQGICWLLGILTSDTD